MALIQATLLLLMLLVWAAVGRVPMGPSASSRWSSRRPMPKPGLQQNSAEGVSKTVGQVWPLPQQIRTDPTRVLVLSPETFMFHSDAQCDTLTAAFNRYYQLIFFPTRGADGRTRRPKRTPNKHWPASGTSKRKLQKEVPPSMQNLNSLKISLLGPCEVWPSMDMDEQYQLNINMEGSSAEAQLVATTPWGALRGLETFSQIVYYCKDLGQDAMAYNKFNVFHWHIVDDPSFPYVSTTFPEMSEKGAYNPDTHIYTQQDIRDVIEYARARGIRVVPEFDTPGHTLSWGAGIPNLLTKCYDSQGKPNGKYGPINPILPSTYTFLEKFFLEVGKVFQDEYIHLGGDEVSFDCWESNPSIQRFMQKRNYTSYSELEALYVSLLLDIVAKQNSSYIIWQEVVDNGVVVQADAVVEVWKNDDDPMGEMKKVTALGHRAILAACWYLDEISYGTDWHKYYQCEPLAFNGTQAQNRLVIGGEACLWGEFVDGTNLIPRMWPRAIAAAERLWSNRSLTDADAATPRFEEQRCRMLSRGIDAEPENGPGFCDDDYLVH